MQSFRFDRFLLDCSDRQLRDGDRPVELNARYFDALALLLRDAGRLVSKDRFHEEVWKGVPVTDEALTQCIKTLRRQLNDDAARPRFIETVPKHGYRFIAPVERVKVGIPEQASPTLAAPASSSLPPALVLGLAGTAGGALAGVTGGLFYGFASAPQPGVGAASVILVLVCVTTIVALLGAAGVSLGIAATDRFGPWKAAGGAAGGLVIGAIVKLVGLDAFALLFGHSPGDITGAGEGALIGAAAGLGAWLGLDRPLSLRRGVAVAGVIGGVAGTVVTLLGGRMMAGSLDLLVQGFPDSRLRLDAIGGLFGEPGLGTAAQLVTGGLEGALFASCVVGAMMLTRGKVGVGPASAGPSPVGDQSQ